MKHVRDFTPDGQYLPTIKAHSCEKLNLHNDYSALFTSGMQQQWPNLVYLGLYSGAGAAVVEGSNRTIMTSALSALTQECPFTNYIFVDEDPRCNAALSARARAVGMSDRTRIIECSVNSCADRVLDALPNWRQAGGVLTFCFIDPFRVDLDFEVIQRLSHLRIDILLMVPLGYDVRRNWRDYLEKPSMRDRLSAFLGESGWMDEWARLGRAHSEFPRFVQSRMNAAMQRLKFIELQHRDIKDVKVTGKNVYLYSLHLFSKNPVAIKFWRQALKRTTDQGTLDI